MSYHELARLGLSFRPIDRWPGMLNPSRRYSNFSASLSQTVTLLARELNLLQAEHVVLQVALPESQIRLDGFPRADARAEHPGVILAFDSKWGPLSYDTDEFTHWTDNLRAIALSMEALRAVDRYGVSKRGEQYRGWRQLPERASDPADMIHSPDQATFYLERWGGDVRRAIKETHPDRGGDEAEFRAVQRCRELLEAA